MSIIPFTKFNGASAGINRIYTKNAGASADINGIWRFDGTTPELIYQRSRWLQNADNVWKLQITTTSMNRYNSFALGDGGIVQEIVKGTLKSLDDTYQSNSAALCYSFFNYHTVAIDFSGHPTGSRASFLSTYPNAQWLVEYRRKDGANDLTEVIVLNTSDSGLGSTRIFNPDGSSAFGNSMYWTRSGYAVTTSNRQDDDEWWIYGFNAVPSDPEWSPTSFALP